MGKAIVAKNITKKYKLYESTKERMLDLITPREYGEEFYALTNVSFEAEKGDIIGFIGVNGSGKSTLSNIIAGIVPETSGEVIVNGETSLIAVAAGLKGDLTGRDNIELKCLMLGLSREEIKELEPSIIEFSELGQFIDQPVKSYSSGMRSRLGFSISVNVDPDILIIDEALSVGDRAFAEKSFKKMKEFKEQGKTMIFVSHSLGQMKQFCEKILWLEYGMVRKFGSVKKVIPKYERFLKKWKEMSKEERVIYQKSITDYQQRVLSEPKNNQVPEGWLDQRESRQTSLYKEEFISRLGHIKAGESYIYSSPTNMTDNKSSNRYKNKVYFIKIQAIYDDELFYLLSNRPSAKKGIIGWMKASDVTSHLHVAIHNDSQILRMNGMGSGYSKPWGGRKDLVYSDLGRYRDYEFVVDKTEKVGNNVWYRGLLDEKRVWIHSNHVDKIKTL